MTSTRGCPALLASAVALDQGLTPRGAGYTIDLTTAT
jgi:hypothetical protein